MWVILALSLFFSSFFHRPPPPMRSMVSIVMTEDGSNRRVCTGFVVDTQLHEVITARHCIREEDDPLIDDRPAEVLFEDENFILLATETTKPAVVLERGLPPLAAPVIAYGYGYGQMQILHRYISSWDESGMVYLDGPLAPGMSGGPVFNAAGKVVGLNQATAQALSQVSGVGLIRSFLAASHNASAR